MITKGFGLVQGEWEGGKSADLPRIGVAKPYRKRLISTNEPYSQRLPRIGGIRAIKIRFEFHLG